MTSTKNIQIGLATIRITVTAFFLIWSIEKIIAPEITQGVFSRFYSLTISSGFSVFIGIVQTAIVLLFLAGLFKLWTYGALLGMHAASVIAAHQPLFDPYMPPNHLFWAGVPTLGALIALFLMRDEDQLFTFSSLFGARARQ
ncbi:hypothetical protein [Vacuolonema iberomarrocanum]|uniref:hypothetical protein n=1 Tax=Vacuolonema iberomarrocanum TaxID=3454632 RepID=UPI0019EFB9E3|nr:DoxX protein [filamentous cyanobacterium LEGE 07170]